MKLDRSLLVLLCATASVLVPRVEAADILAIFPFQSKSHFVMLEALAKGLAARGHRITVVGHFPQKTPVPNYTDVSLEGTAAGIVNNITVDFIREQWQNPVRVLRFVWREAGAAQCHLVYRSDAFQRLLRSDATFDLVLTEMWGSDCFLPVANLYGAPHASLITTMEVPWGLARYASPFNPSHQVSHFTDFSPRGMSFRQRLFNAVFTAYMKIGHHFYSEIPSDAIAREYLGQDVPDLARVVRNSSLLFVNSHFSVTGPRPLAPNVVEVGGLHIAPAKPLPEVFQRYLDEASDGVVLFSLGSLIRADTLEPRVLQAFVDAFRHLRCRVVWKYNGTVPGQPENVRTFDWVPQSDILRHPNVRLFITHGGLMGTQEAITAGVPMLGIPFFADQRFNLKNYQELGFAINLELEDVTPRTVLRALRRLLDTPRFAKKAKYYSRLFADRPQTALETAIYWTEYVIRHKGADHLRPHAAGMSFAEYHLVDVGICLGTALAVLGWILFRVLRFCIARSGRRLGKAKKD